MTVTKLTPKYARQAEKILSGLTKQQIEDVAGFFTSQFLEDIKQGLEGEIEYKDSAVFEMVDKLYEEFSAPPSGCYFCDRKIDGNEVPFDYPATTRLCLTCQFKVANLMKAFAIDPRCLFPHIKERKVQPVVYNQVKIPIKAEGEMVH